MFPFFPSTTADQKLEDVLSRIKKHPEVDGILLMGSAANDVRSAHGDFDLAFIVKDVPKGVLGINTFIENTFAEIFFYSVAEVKAILKKETVDPGSKEGWLVHWSRSGRIIFDASGLLQKLKGRSSLITDTVGYSYAYQSWQRINYNLVQNTRYFQSDDEAHLQALNVKLAYCLVEALVSYFNIRLIPWRGEKEAIVWLKEHDKVFLDLLEAGLKELDLAQKMKFYQEMVSVALEPVGGTWKMPSVSAVSTGDVNEDIVRSGLNYFDGLLT